MPSRRTPVAAVVVAILAAGCGGVRHHSLIGDPSPVGGPVDAVTTTLATPTTPPPTTTTTAPPATTTSAPPPTTLPPRPPRPYAVGWTALSLTDPSRATGSTSGRHLQTLIFYPAAGSDPAAETNNAPGLAGPWALIVFAHGYNTTPLTYHDLIHHLASSGFVVAAPYFPLEAAPGPLDENDLSNEPGDIKFVITQVIAASGKSGLLSGLVDSGHIAAVGHSDGGEAVLGAAFLPSGDSRIGPVVAMSAQAILNGDKVSATSTRHPLLVVQGTADTINPPARSDVVFQTAPSPKAYLRLFGAGHLPPMTDPNQWRPVVETTIVDWLDAWFPGPYGPSAAGRLGHDANVPGTSSIQLG